jgi:hypothetical protein
VTSERLRTTILRGDLLPTKRLPAYPLQRTA